MSTPSATVAQLDAAVAKPTMPRAESWKIMPAPMKPTPVAIPAMMRPSLLTPTATTANAAAPMPSSENVRGPAGLPRSNRSRPTNKPNAPASAMRPMASQSPTWLRTKAVLRKKFDQSGFVERSRTLRGSDARRTHARSDTVSQQSLDLGDIAEEPTFSVGELTTRVIDALRRAFPEQVWVRGEVQNLKRYASGHTYFTLVERAAAGDRVRARLDCVLFRDDRAAINRALKAVPGAELGNDVEVRIRGRVSVYQGRLQLVMSAIDPVFTVGGIAANREKVLRTLAADGLLDVNARLPIPLVPLNVGLVTSLG